MLSCRELTERSTDYLEGRLTLRQRLQARLHLLLCRYCRGYLHQTKATVAMLAQLPKEAPPPETTAALLAAFRKKNAPPGEP